MFKTNDITVKKHMITVRKFTFYLKHITALPTQLELLLYTDLIYIYIYMDAITSIYYFICFTTTVTYIGSFVKDLFFDKDPI